MHLLKLLSNIGIGLSALFVCSILLVIDDHWKLEQFAPLAIIYALFTLALSIVGVTRKRKRRMRY